MSILYRIKDLRYQFRWIKWWYQRAKRGYADCDVWSIDYYLNSFLPRMLRQLKDETHGHPSSVKGFKTWQGILEKIALGFEASQRLANSDNWVLNEGSEMIFMPPKEGENTGEIKFTNEWTPEQIKHFRELDRKDHQIFKHGMELFVKYYMGLWD